MQLHKMWQDYPNLVPELEMTIQLMENSVKLKNKSVEKAILDMIHSGGKLLRPAYQLLFFQFGPNQDVKKATSLAAAIEMLHTATLIHDDVVDRSELRRNLPTINAQFDNTTAVYAGDYLLISCFKLLADYTQTLNSLQINSRNIEKILDGELGQMNNRYRLDGTIDEYLENISGKTAELFALSCGIGALESGCSEKFSKKCGEIGLNIGLAFQIIDDLLDYTQSSEKIGKPVLEDVRQGIYSLPLLYALQENKAQLCPYLLKKEQMTTADAQAVWQIVQQSKGIEKAKKLASDYTNKALKAIEKLPDTPKQTKTHLYNLTASILQRQN